MGAKETTSYTPNTIKENLKIIIGKNSKIDQQDGNYIDKILELKGDTNEKLKKFMKEPFEDMLENGYTFENDFDFSNLYNLSKISGYKTLDLKKIIEQNKELLLNNSILSDGNEGVYVYSGESKRLIGKILSNGTYQKRKNFSLTEKAYVYGSVDNIANNNKLGVNLIRLNHVKNGF